MMRVLIVAANPRCAVARILQEMASRNAVEIVADTVQSIPQAMTALSGSIYHALALDMTDSALREDMAPFHELRRLHPTLPIVILSGVREADLATLALRAGAVDTVDLQDLDVRGLWRAVYFAVLREAHAAAYTETATALDDLLERIDRIEEIIEQLIQRGEES